MGGRTAAVLAFACLAGCASAPDGGAGRARIDAVAAAERAFAADASGHGVKAAFLAALADDATLFRPGPVDGKAFLAAHGDPPIRLAWEPSRVAVAASDDLAYSSGPWRLTPNADPGTPLAGHFLTVWRRVDDGRWRVLIDHGAGGPARMDGSFEPLVGDGSPARLGVAAAEAAFAQSTAADGLGAAYRAQGSDRIRLLRDEAPPFDGLDAIARMPDADARWTWTMTDSGTSAGGDLAWTMGRYRAAAAGGYYVRVWRTERGEWKILGDVLARVADTNP